MTKKFEIKTTTDFYNFSVYINTDLYNYVERNLDFKPFDVTIEEHKESKSGKQLRGFFRLCQHIAPYLQEMTGEIWDKDRVRYYIELRAGYVSIYKGIATPKSLAKATMEEMAKLIYHLSEFGDEMDIPDCYLIGDEQRELEEYYNNKVKE